MSEQTDATASTPNASGGKKPMARWRLALLGACLVVGGGVLAFARLSEDVATQGNTTAFTILALLLSLILVFLWFLLFSGLTIKRRLLGAALVCGLALLLRGMVRVDGFYGDILPIFTWRWTPPPDYQLPELEPTTAAGSSASEGVEPGPLDFPQFLGASQDGVVSDEALAGEWWRGPFTERWRRKTGAGWSGWVTAGPYAYTQEQRGAHEYVVCVKLADGKEHWAHRDEARFSESMGGDGPRATPAVAGGAVYALGATGILNCLDAASGELRWSKNVLEENGHANLQWAKASSPVVRNGLVYVALGKSKDRSTAAYRTKDGTLAWRAGEDEASYSTPVIGTLAGREQLVVLYANSVAGHHPETGDVFWTYEWKGGPAKVASPKLLDSEKVFLSAGYGLGCRLLKIVQKDGGFEAELLWKSLQMKTKFTNAVVRGGYVYGLDEGRIACVNLADGKRAWKGDSLGQGQVLAVGDCILVQEEDGGVAVVAANPAEQKILARHEALSAKTWNYPCVAGNVLLVRNDRETICFELPGKGGE